MTHKKLINNAKRGFVIISILVLAAAIPVILCSNRAQGIPGLADAALFESSVNAIERDYLDPSRMDPQKMLKASLDLVQRTIPEILVKETEPGVTSVTVGLAEKRFQTGHVKTASDLKGVMREMLKFIAANYHGDAKPEEIEYAAIDGMLEVLDPHSNFMPPKVYNEFKVGTRGKFGGLGIVISIKDGMLTVIAPIEGTPASRAGIKAGDRILQIDDESTINMSLTDAVNRLRGDAGVKVSLIVERPGRPPKKISLTRAIINIDSVQSRLLEAGEKRIGYVRIKNFQANTDEDMSAALKEFRKNGARLDGLILDLRNNPGGLLNVAVDVTDHFIKEGIIVSTVGAGDEVMEKDSARGTGDEEDYPLVVLMNEGSASASEIVAGALQANNRAIIMGSRSFGKGSVQTIFELGEGSALKLTIAQYKPAGTETIQLTGVVPDISILPVVVDRKLMNLVEDILPSEQDLEQHLERGIAPAQKSENSALSIKYLKPAESEKDLEAQSAREYAKEPDLGKDFYAGLARNLIAKGGAPTRKGMLAKAGVPLKAAEAEEDKKINDAIKPMGIDWSTTKIQGAPKIKLSYRIKKGGATIARAKAGDKVEIEITAANTGAGEYSRLIAVGQSDVPFLSNIEFPFGRIPAGQTRSFSSQIELPEGLVKQNLIMDVSLENANGSPPAPSVIYVPVDEIAKPSFAFAYTLPSVVKGKSMATGASIPLQLEVTNTGNGATSAETTATLSNECGEKLFIENGRTKLGVIAPKASRRAAFRFHVISDFAATACGLKLTIADTKRFVVLTKKIDLLVKEGEVKPPAGQRCAPPTVDVVKAPSSTDAATALLSGTIKDADPVRDFFVFSGEKKVAYIPNASGTNEMPFSVTVPLDPGNNLITIGARDELDLVGRKAVVIERTSGERKKKASRDAQFGPEMQP